MCRMKKCRQYSSGNFCEFFMVSELLHTTSFNEVLKKAGTLL